MMTIGSQTLRKWQKLANFGLDGLNEEQNDKSEKEKGSKLDIRYKGFEEFEGSDIISNIFTDGTDKKIDSNLPLQSSLSRVSSNKSIAPSSIEEHSVAFTLSDTTTTAIPSTITTTTATSYSITEAIQSAAIASISSIGVNSKTLKDPFSQGIILPTHAQTKFAGKSQTTMTYTYSNVSLNQNNQSKDKEFLEQLASPTTNGVSNQDTILDTSPSYNTVSQNSQGANSGLISSPLVAFAKTIGPRQSLLSPYLSTTSSAVYGTNINGSTSSYQAKSNDSEVDEVLPKSSTPINKSVPSMASIMMFRSNSVVKRNLSSLLLQPKK